MIQIRKEILQFNIDLKEIKSNVESSIKDCNYPSNKKNNVLLTFLFMSIQLFNKIAIKNNIEPITLKQLNELESHKGGGRRKRKKTKKKKKKLKKKKTHINTYYNNENNYFSNYSKRRNHHKDMSTFTNILSKISLGATLLMIILASLGTVDAQVSSVGMPFDDFVEVIHNTVGIGNNSLSYIEQHDLTVNYGSLYNDTQTFVKGYCAAMSAVSAGLIMIDEFNQLLINKGYVTIFDEFMKIKNKELTPKEILLQKKKNIKKRLSARPRDLSEGDMSKSINLKPRLTRLNILKLKRKIYHPGVMSGYPIAQISNTQIVSTIFEIRSKKITKYEKTNMINLVHQKLIQDRKFAVDEGIIQINDVVSGIITYPGHAMTVTVLPSGALVVRNADLLHTDTTKNWLTYKPPLNIDLNNKSSSETKQTINEWNKLNKKINSRTRKTAREISKDGKSYEKNDTSILSYFHKKPILSSNWLNNTPKDSLTPFLLEKMVRGSVIKLIGHQTFDQNIKYPHSKNNSFGSLKKLEEAKEWTEIRKDIKCGGVAIADFFNCIRNMNVGETITYNKGTHNIGTKEVSISQYIHTPEQLINTNKLQQRRNNIRADMSDLQQQARKARETKRLNHTELIQRSYAGSQ